MLWQSFLGFRIATEKPLDEETCTLMNFNVPQHGATHFMYILPTAEHEALVEFTRFGKDCLDLKKAHYVLDDFIARNMGASEILDTETGRIPMTLGLNAKRRNHESGSTLIPIGTRAGAVKSTTGYAFMNMANHAKAIADSLCSGQQMPTAYHPRRLAFYDKLLLTVLIESPESGKKVFQQLFRKSRTAPVLLFLDERTHLVQELKILSKLPFRPFLKALWSTTCDSAGTYFSASKEAVNQHSPSFIDGIVILIALALVSWNLLWPDGLMAASPWIVLAGLIFPGIPHGAVDHWVAFGADFQWRKLGSFVLRYISLMAAVALLWFIQPWLGLLLFLLYSAWHFGETDLRDWKAFSPAAAIAWGLSLLGPCFSAIFMNLPPT